MHGDVCAKGILVRRDGNDNWVVKRPDGRFLSIPAWNLS